MAIGRKKRSLRKDCEIGKCLNGILVGQTDIVALQNLSQTTMDMYWTVLKKLNARHGEHIRFALLAITNAITHAYKLPFIQNI